MKLRTRQLLSGFVIAAFLGLPLMTGCSAAHYKRSADKEVYSILSHKKKAALNDETPFTIEQAPADYLRTLPHRYQPIIPPAEGGESPSGPKPAIISLSDALAIGLRNSREYQRRKEQVYLAALDLTRERDRFSPTLTALLSGEYRRTDTDESWAGDTTFGISQLLATGAEISLTLTSSLLRYTTGAPRESAASSLAFELIQPLWRGAGQRIAQENLTQAERNVVYELRSFARFHKTFAVSIVREYYQILQQRAVVRNQWNNYRQLMMARDRAESLAEAGRRPAFEVDQARQDELRARDRYIRAVQRYEQLLDGFKRTLALPPDVSIDVDESDLKRLMTEGIHHPDIRLDDAIRQALALRLDVMNADDAVSDAERKVRVAKNGLGPDVDLVLSATAPTEETQPARFRFSKTSYSAGLDVSLPVERTAERNTYRRTLIELERARRAADDLRDQVRLQVRQAWRNLQEARDSYEIQRRSLELAQRRVESIPDLIEGGRATTRDLLESQAALLEAQNALAQVLVDHLIARLELWRDVETLTVGPEGEMKGPSL